MKKKIISMLLLGVLSLSLMGCAWDNVSRETIKTSNNRFVKVGDCHYIGGDYNVYYDSITNIVYLVADSAQQSGITVIYNKDGKPMTLDEYKTTR